MLQIPPQLQSYPSPSGVRQFASAVAVEEGDYPEVQVQNLFAVVVVVAVAVDVVVAVPA